MDKPLPMLFLGGGEGLDVGVSRGRVLAIKGAIVVVDD